MRVIFLWVFTLAYSLCNSQTIVNTENLLSAAQDDLTISLGFKGNLSFGNINLIDVSTTQQIAKRSDHGLLRLIGNYAYLNQNRLRTASDFTGQLRYNYFIKDKNSVYTFFQLQNIESLRMNRRLLVGAGYRVNVFKSNSNYLDVAIGGFSENERYDAGQLEELEVKNLRLSSNLFMRVTLAERLFINNVIYYQLNFKSFNDYRIYLEPRLNYSINEKANLFINLTHWYHSSPYIANVEQYDSRLMFGFEFNLK